MVATQPANPANSRHPRPPQAQYLKIRARVTRVKRSCPRCEPVPKKLHDFVDKNMLQLFEIERFLFDHVIPRDREALSPRLSMAMKKPSVPLVSGVRRKPNPNREANRPRPGIRAMSASSGAETLL